MQTDISKFFVDKAPLQKIVADVYEQMGLSGKPTMTREEIRASMRAQGVCAEDNIFSCGILAARDEE